MSGENGRGRVASGERREDFGYQSSTEYWVEYFTNNTHLGDGRESNPYYSDSSNYKKLQGTPKSKL